MNGQAMQQYSVNDPRAILLNFSDHTSPEYWDAKLSMNHSLAPWDIVLRGLDSIRSYNTESRRLGGLGSNQATNELEELISLHGAGFSGRAVVLGPGLWTRDEDFYVKANWKGLSFIAYDISGFSCDRGRNLLLGFPKIAGVKNSIVQADIEDVLLGRNNDRLQSINPNKDLLIYAAEFFQILPRNKMEHVMFLLGKKYRHHPENFRMVVVHPFDKDNRQPVQWAHHQFQGVKWGDTTPYSLAELKARLEEGLKQRVEALRMHKSRYYHQCYSAFTLVAAG